MGYNKPNDGDLSWISFKEAHTIYYDFCIDALRISYCVYVFSYQQERFVGFKLFIAS